MGLKKKWGAVLLAAALLLQPGCTSRDSAKGEPSAPASESAVDAQGEEREAVAVELREPHLAEQGVRVIPLEEISYEVTKVRSVLQPLPVPVESFRSVEHLDGEYLYLSVRNGPYQQNLMAVSLDSGEAAGELEAYGTVWFAKDRVFSVEAEFDGETPVSETITEYTKDLNPVAVYDVTGTAQSTSAMAYVDALDGFLLSGGDSLVRMDRQSEEVQNLDTSFLSENASIYMVEPTLVPGCVLLTLLFEGATGRREEVVLYHVENQATVGDSVQVITDGAGSERNKYYQVDSTTGFVFLPDQFLVEGFTLGPFVPRYGVFMGRGTYSTDSVCEVALIDPVGATLQRTLPGEELDVYPLYAVSANQVLVEYLQDGRRCLGILGFSTEEDSYEGDRMDLSAEYLDSLRGKHLPEIGEDRNWGDGPAGPTTLALLSDLIYPYATAYNYTVMFEEVELNQTELATVAVLELLSLGRYPQMEQERFAVPDEWGFDQYQVDPAQMDQLVTALFPDTGGAAPVSGEFTPGYREELDIYYFWPRATAFSGNYALPTQLSCQLESAAFDEDSGILSLEAVGFSRNHLWEQVRLDLAIAAKVDPRTGEFTYDSIQISESLQQ